MRRFAILFALLLVFPTLAGADTLKVIGAGSLSAAFTDLLRQFPPDPTAPCRPSSAHPG